MTIEFEMYKGMLRNDFLIFIRAFFESCRELFAGSYERG